MEFEMTEEQKSLFKKLTKLQQKICLNKLSGKYETDLEVYRASGGKAVSNNNASATMYEIMRRDDVKNFMIAMQGSIISDTIMSRKEALEFLTQVARVKITDIAEFSETEIPGEDGADPVKMTTWRIFNSDQLSPAAAASIKSVTSTKMGPKLELHDPMNAIQQLAKMEGWDSPAKIELSGEVNTRSNLDDFYGSNDEPNSKP